MNYLHYLISEHHISYFELHLLNAQVSNAMYIVEKMLQIMLNSLHPANLIFCAMVKQDNCW